MTVLALLNKLRKNKINIWVEGDKLRYSAPKGLLSENLRNEIAARRTEILTFLRAGRIETPPIVPIGSKFGNIPLSFAQQRLWYMDQLEPNMSVYNLPFSFRLTGKLEKDALKRCIDEIVKRHEVLRTTFKIDGDLPVQVIAPPFELNIPFIDFSDRTVSERESDLGLFLKSEACKPFDLAEGPLVRATLIRIDKEDHVLFFMVHHIVFDGWSIGVFQSELIAIYNAFAVGKPSPLPENKIQYADFAVWQHELLQGEVLDKQLAYWKKQLGGEFPVLEFPTDRPRPAVQTYWGAKESLILTERLTQRLKQLCKQEGVTLYITLLAAFNTLLYRYSGQADIAIGSVIANRNRLEIEGLIGFFVNTLVLRNDLGGNPSFRDLLLRVRDVTLGAYDHQDLPFEKLVEELNPVRDLSRSPLVQAGFALEQFSPEPEEFSNLKLHPTAIDTGTCMLDLTLFIGEKAGKLICRAEYNTDLFNQASIVRMLGHFATLLEGIVDNPGQCISDLTILNESEREQILVKWNDNKVNHTRGGCIHEMIEEQVERTPDSIAIVHEKQKLTYRELNTLANHLAYKLMAHGIGPECLVGICADRSPEMLVGILGVLKTGAAYMPMDPNYPEERLRYMLADSKVPILLTRKSLADKIPKHEGSIIFLDIDWPLMSAHPNVNPRSGVSGDNLAYIIYTSGSTGKPKGTMIQHKGASNLINYLDEFLEIGEDSRVLQFAAFGFDATIFEIFPTLSAGGALYLAPLRILSSGEDLIEYLHENEISVVTLPPSLLAILPKRELPFLKTLISAGEQCPWSVASRWRIGRRFINGYGPTETTVATSFYLVEQDRSNESGTVPIGRPICNFEVYVLDKNMQPVPVGIAGELYVGGIGLARGYLNRPELSAEKFIPNPFSRKHGDLLYKTGDLVRYLSDGCLEFIGRIDHQVKLRGFRIELGEIETLLRKDPAVRDCIAMVREDSPGDKRLVAYLVTNEDHEASPSELRRFLKKLLPDYMIPSAIVFLDSFPITPNGKIDRMALPAPEIKRKVDEEFLEPKSHMERTFAVIWMEVLKQDKVGTNDNFFDLGGNSMLAMQVIARLERETGVRLNPVEFVSQTLGQISGIVDEKLKKVTENDVVEAIRPMGIFSSLFKSIFQKS